jgi:hypothetical protein
MRHALNSLSHKPAARGNPAPKREDHVTKRTRLRRKYLILMAGPTGIEPATSCVTGRRSNQAELRPRRGEVVGDVRFERTTFPV